MTKENEIAERIAQALKEVELIEKGELPKRTAREMIERVRRQLDDEGKRSK